MAVDLLEYKIKRHFSVINQLVTELVIIRKYLHSVEKGLNYCREHVSRGEIMGGNRSCSMELIKNQEQMLVGLRKAEKKVKKRLGDASRELAFLCRRENLR